MACWRISAGRTPTSRTPKARCAQAWRSSRRSVRQQLSVRIGIATGLVVTGDLVGVGAAQTVTAVGETPNLAARLQALAQPDTVVVSEATQAQLGQMFELEDLGLHALKGFAMPVRAWRVLGKTAAVSRSEVVYASALTPLVGRDEELGQPAAPVATRRKPARGGSFCSPVRPVSASRACSRRSRSG